MENRIEEQIISIYTLTKESLNKLEAFSRKYDRNLTDKSKSYLDALKGFFEKGDSNSADKTLESKKNNVRRSLTNPEVKKDFERYELRHEKHLALKHHIAADSDDFTFYLVEKTEIVALLELLKDSYTRKSGATRSLKRRGEAARQVEEEPRFSYDQELWLWDEDRQKVARGRALACSCHQGGQWSVTFRLTKQWPEEKPKAIFLNKVKVISDLLKELIFETEIQEEHGLIVITGRTAACKSQMAHKLIETRLEGTSGKHLPTFEDPIERHFDIPDVNYTPREKGKDVSGLEEAINNALRQKPAVLFVGETRNPEEWKLLVKFAGTGHLVVTTAHAGSLVEAMGNILQATEANEAAARSLVGERLLAVIHMKPEKIACHNGLQVGILIPALWRRTPEGVKALMAEGLSSLVPHTARPFSRAERENLPSSIGRYWFARELLKDGNIDGEADKVLSPEIREKIKTVALEWDLEGV